MKAFIMVNHKRQLEKFEVLRQVVKKRRQNDELHSTILKMVSLLNNKDQLQLLANEFPLHFTSTTSWQMELDIAIEVLNNELKSESLSYLYELNNYLFYYLLLPPEYSNTFFLMHGIAVDFDQTMVKKMISSVKDQYYPIYKNGQELYSTYVLYIRSLGAESRQTIEQKYPMFSCVNSNENHSENIVILQTTQNS